MRGTTYHVKFNFSKKTALRKWSAVLSLQKTLECAIFEVSFEQTLSPHGWPPVFEKKPNYPHQDQSR